MQTTREEGACTKGLLEIDIYVFLSLHLNTNMSQQRVTLYAAKHKTATRERTTIRVNGVSEKNF